MLGLDALAPGVEADGEGVIVDGFFLMALRSKTPWSTISFGRSEGSGEHVIQI